MYKLSNKPDTVIRLFDNAFIQFNELNPDYLSYLDWVSQGNAPEPADVVVEEKPSPKLVGIEFQGVMCSATTDDAAGLLQVKAGIELMGAEFKTKFAFANGNKLWMSASNFKDFMRVWMPFRQSFFNSEDTLSVKDALSAEESV